MGQRSGDKVVALSGRARAGEALYTIGCVLVALILGVLGVLSLCVTGFFPEVHGEAQVISTLLDAGHLPAMALGLVCAVGVVALLVVVWRHADGVDERVLLAAAVALTALAQVAWILVQHTADCGFPDSHQLVMHASLAAQGDFDTFLPPPPSTGAPDPAAHAYFASYPFQAGVFFVFLGMFKVFGVGNVLSLQLLNVVANEVTLVCVVALGRTFLEGARSRVTLVVLLCLCAPLFVSCSLPYGNSLGLALGCIFLVLQARALRETVGMRRIAFAAASLVPLAFALMVKSTILLFGIAALIAWLVEAFRSHALPALLVTVAVVLVANMASALPTRALESMAQSSFGEGMSKTLWIAMGLRDDNPLELPGWWSHWAFDVFNGTQGDPAAEKQAALDSISASLARFASDPGYAVRFFATKTESEWCEPTYQSFYYASLDQDADGNLFDPYAGRVVGRIDSAVTVALDGYQLVVYAGAFAGVVSLVRSRRRDAAALLSVACVFVGFGCYLLWEAKSIYVLPFVVVMLPLAAYGLDAVMRRASRDTAGGRQERRAAS